MSNVNDLLNRLSIVHQDVKDMAGHKILLLDEHDRGGDQIGLEDAPGEMILGFSDEDLLENAELPEEDCRLLQEHRIAVIEWVKSRGFKPLVDPGGPHGW